MKLFFIVCIIVLSMTQTPYAHEEHAMSSDLAISATFDKVGNLWRVQVKHGFVELSHSKDLGKTFSKPVIVNKTPQNIHPMGEVRPKIAVGPTGAIYVTWMENLKPRFSSHIWFARSLDAGKTFEAPYIVHQDRAEIGHAFEELKVAPNGDVTVVWLDARDLVAAKSYGKTHRGSSIYYAVSKDQGKSFAPENKLADSSCECCRIATAIKTDGTGLSTVVALWRHVFEGNERDHMIAEVPQGDAKPTAHRATFGHWEIDGCPHHGAALAPGGEGKDWWGYHMAYFDGSDKNKAGSGLYYSRMDGVAWASSVPKKFGNHQKQASHPAILSVGEKVWLVWRETEAKNNTIVGMFSDDGGRNWGATKVLASSADKADYPQLLFNTKDAQIVLVWNTLKDGLKVFNLKDLF